MGYVYLKSTDPDYYSRPSNQDGDRSAIDVINRAALAKDMKMVPLKGADHLKLWLKREAALVLQLLSRAGRAAGSDYSSVSYSKI